MIYEGKEYVEVLNSEVRTGDLLIVFKLNHAVLSKNKYLKYTSAVHSKEDLVLIAKNHSDMLVELSSNHDGWRTYRYVKDVEENSSFSVGDTVKIVGPSILGSDEFIGYTGPIARIYDDGDIMVQDFGEFTEVLPPSSLELIENNTEKAHRELNKTIIKIDKEMINHLKKSKKAHDLIEQTDTVNSPSHYNQTKIEAIDIIEDVTAGYQSNVKYHIGNAIKYLIRAPFKNNTVEDLKKAVWYIQRAIEKLEGEE
ncbi:DUF3310 domain-containing protein [Brochothrix thermosphacta]|nr:DUF3310 domain-containing protein [Brochothrix thermosphacta]